MRLRYLQLPVDVLNFLLLLLRCREPCHTATVFLLSCNRVVKCRWIRAADTSMVCQQYSPLYKLPACSMHTFIAMYMPIAAVCRPICNSMQRVGLDSNSPQSKSYDIPYKSTTMAVTAMPNQLLSCRAGLSAGTDSMLPPRYIEKLE